MVTLNVQDGSEAVSASLVRGHASVVACMTSLEAANGQEAGKVVYDSDGHFRRMSLNGLAVFEPAEADRRVAAGQTAKDARAGAQGQNRGQRSVRVRNRAETEGR